MMAPESLLTTLTAVGLLGCAVLLVLAELHIPTHGLHAIPGLAALLLGIFLLFAPAEATWPILALIAAHALLLLVLGAVFAGLLLLALRASLRVHRMPVVDPLAQVAGARGIVTSPLAPDGTVRVLHETWSAVTTGAPIARGEAVEVVAREGLTLHVRPMARRGERDGLPSQGAVRPGVWVERGR